MIRRASCRPLARASLLLRRSLLSGLGWHDDPLAGVRQIDGIGPAYAAKLSDAGCGSLELLVQQMSSRLDLLCGKASPFGANVQRHARALLASAPMLSAEVGGGTTSASQPVQVTVHLHRAADATGGGMPAAASSSSSSSLPLPRMGGIRGSPWLLLVSDSHHQLLLIRRLSQEQLDAQPHTSFKLSVTPASSGAAFRSSA